MNDSETTQPDDEAASPSDRRTKFVELAQNRTINAIRAIRVIGKLGNKAHYDFDEADVKKIADALAREVDALRLRMTQRAAKPEVAFRL
jgi:uncharacterized membrane protein YkoI